MLRRRLIVTASFLAVGSYAWFRVAYERGAPALTDLPSDLMLILLPVVLLALVVGAAVLWGSTRHSAALAQLIACSVTFILAVVEETARYLGPESQLWQITHRPLVQLAVQSIILVCLLAFAAAYIWYAHTPKRI
jgi:predicted membrane protein